jgi:hypothetical protein
LEGKIAQTTAGLVEQAQLQVALVVATIEAVPDRRVAVPDVLRIAFSSFLVLSLTLFRGAV